MSTQLDSLRKLTTVVADTGDIEAIKKFKPVDATTNPSLLLKASELPQYNNLIHTSIDWAKSQSNNPSQRIIDAADQLAVRIGNEIANIVPGRISTEVDARLSFDRDASIAKAHRLIDLYAQHGVDKSRVLIKLAATWEGIKAAEALELEGINTNLTLLFSFAQARACADAGVFLISPFVGRILDWHKAKHKIDQYPPSKDPGVLSVTKIYKYYKQRAYKTIVMGASFRNCDEIRQLAGCDRLTIGPNLLTELENTDGELKQKLNASEPVQTREPAMTESQYRLQHNSDPMAVEKLSEGIRNFIVDQEKLELKLKTIMNDKN